MSNPLKWAQKQAERPVKWAYNTAAQTAGIQPSRLNREQQKYAALAGRVAFNMSGIPDITRAQQNPSLKNYLMAAAATPMVTLPFKSSLGKSLNAAADTDQLVRALRGDRSAQGLGDYEKWFNSLPFYGGGDKKGTYRVAVGGQTGNLTKEQLAQLRRAPILQDAKTGQILIGYGAGEVHHENMLGAMAKQGGSAAGRPWMQSEIWGADRGLNVPSRINWNQFGTTPDTPAATLARMKMIRGLAKEQGMAFTPNNGKSLRAIIDKMENKAAGTLGRSLRTPNPATPVKQQNQQSQAQIKALLAKKYPEFNKPLPKATQQRIAQVDKMSLQEIQAENRRKAAALQAQLAKRPRG